MSINTCGRTSTSGGWPANKLMVSRGGEIVHTSAYGLRDIASRTPVTPDTRWRIYSMTNMVPPIEDAIRPDLYRLVYPVL